MSQYAENIVIISAETIEAISNRIRAMIGGAARLVTGTTTGVAHLTRTSIGTTANLATSALRGSAVVAGEAAKGTITAAQVAARAGKATIKYVERHRARKALQSALEELEGHNTALLKKWMPEELEVLEGHIAAAKQAMGTPEDLTTATQHLKAAEAALQQALGNAVELEQRAQEQHYIAAALIASLQDIGFTNINAAPHNPEDPASPVIVEAMKSTGESARVVLTPEQALSLDMDGYQAGACKEDWQAVLQHLHAQSGIQCIEQEGHDKPDNEAQAEAAACKNA